MSVVRSPDAIDASRAAFGVGRRTLEPVPLGLLRCADELPASPPELGEKSYSLVHPDALGGGAHVRLLRRQDVLLADATWDDADVEVLPLSHGRHRRAPLRQNCLAWQAGLR